MSEDFTGKFMEVTSKSLDEQARFFLQTFVLEFNGAFEPVLAITEEFRKFLPAGAAPDSGVVEEFAAHQFLESRDETLTVRELRENLKQVKLANHHPVALLEYLLWKYQKTAAEAFTPPKGVDPALLAALDQAIEDFKRALAIREAREAKMRKLEEIAAKGGVKALAAKNELEQMQKEDQLEQNRREITSGAKKRAAAKAVANDTSYAERIQREKEEAMRQEELRLAEESRKREEAEAAKAAESKARLKARAALWN
eukprot:TRINITY_DN757_c0_g1_i1.p1 TRINITY_DN757_c0_g1~~TRINITY_DN757_c0_g1_i1.p1  ORF type:complete len:277 (+),score=132.33 TRINITY_DN757_c0_g1_i1:65-832(+)